MRKFINIGLLAFAVLLTGCSQTKLVQLRATHIPVDQQADAIRDKEMVKVLEPYAAIAIKTADETIGFADQDLTPGRPESLLGNFFADVMLSYAQQHSARKVDLAVTNPGGLRKPIHKGAIKVAHIYELMPFENALVVLDLKGDRVQALADSIAAHHGGPVAGIRFEIKNRKAIDVLVQGAALDPNKIYRIVANDYIAKGNDFYQELTKAQATEAFPVSLRAVILDFVKQENLKGHHINATLDRRIYEDKE